MNHASQSDVCCWLFLQSPHLDRPLLIPEDPKIHSGTQQQVMKRLDKPRLLIVGLVVSSTAVGSFFSTTTPLLLAMRTEAAETRYAKPTDSRFHAVARLPLLPHATCRHSIATWTSCRSSRSLNRHSMSVNNSARYTRLLTSPLAN